MSFLSGIGHALKKGVGIVGSIAKKAAPLVGLIPGVGTVAGGLIGGLGSVADDFGHGRSISIGNALKSGATGAVGGLAGKALLGGKGIAGLSGIGSKIAGLNKGAASPAAPDPMSEFGGSGGFGGAQSTGAPSFLSGIGNYISKNPLQAAQIGLAGANLVAGAKASQNAAALRSKALTRIEQPGPVDLSQLYAGTGNPYARAA